LSSFSSRIFDDAVNELSRLPGIGKRSALRLALHLLKVRDEDVNRLSNAMLRLRTDLKFCRICNNISDTEICGICADPKRDESVVCVVEDIRDIIAIENTNQYRGKYHVLGGIISPMDGIGPEELNISSLTERLKNGNVNELIMALSATMEGDITSYFIFKKINSSEHMSIKFTTIARGVSIGDDLEYADEVTLGRSILNRVPYENSGSIK
jgi:recombination protein RecR